MKTTDYWKQRVLREAHLTRSISTIEKDLKRIYQNSYNRLEKELRRLYLEIIETEGEVLPSHLYQYNRYYDIMNRLQEEMVGLGKREQVVFERELTNVYKYNLTLINPTFNANLNKQAIQEAIRREWLDDVWSNRIWKNTNQLSNKIREHIIDTFATGAKSDDFIKSLMKDFNASYGRAKTLANTELAHYSTQAAVEGYRKEGITKYKVLAEKDCCDTCNELSNKVFDINDDIGLVPLHPNCRCSIVAVV